MQRNEMMARLADREKPWDFLIVGGGATGAGIAVEAVSRGYTVVLLEQADFGKGTSSRSTKLIHGGVRYLQQGNVSLVLEALKERGILRRNAPHLVHNLPFVVPTYDWWEGPFYGIGLKLYDMLAGREGFGDSKILSREETLERIPTIETEGLRGGIIYYDGQFDDARLVINLISTAVDLGATAINYCGVTSLVHENGVVSGAIAVDSENGEKYTVSARVVVNATGPFSDAVRQMDEPSAPAIMQPSQGVHIVLDKSFLPGESAIMVPHTDDGRVLFAIPWHDRVIVGTTDTAIDEPTLEPVPLEEEVAFLLEHAARYLTNDPKPSDVLSVFAGIRPLVRAEGAENTAAISREHTINISRSGLVTIAGGKWTTYRNMAEETVDQAALVAELPLEKSVTRELNIHGYHRSPEQFGELAIYGADAPAVQDLLRKDTSLRAPLHPALPIVEGEVVWAVRYEMARTVEDFLSRRRRALLLDARASESAAARVAEIMARELGRDRTWMQQQVSAYTALVKSYLIGAA